MLRADDSLQINVNEKAVKLLGVTDNHKLSIDSYLNEACKKLSQKVDVLDYFREKTESHYESIYNNSAFLLPLGMDVPQQNIE